ncbi:MAG: Ca2+-binding RTX toxin-like protein [Paracoccaceae bacterium]|jgi:Ca2+-binding RTX toxin-like protein
MANPYATAFKIGVSIGLEIWDRTRPDPLDAINAQLSTLVANSVALLEGIETVQATLVTTELSERESTIKQALFQLRDAQTNGDKAIAENAAQNALDLSLDALTDLTTLTNNTTAGQVARAAIVPLLFSALATRLLIIKELQDGATATHLGDALNDALAAIEATKGDIYREFEEDIITYVDSGQPVFDGSFHYTVTLHFISASDPTIISDPITVSMNLADGVDIGLIGVAGPGPRDTAKFLEWGQNNGVNFYTPIYPLRVADFEAAGRPEMLDFLDEVDYLTSGTWHLGASENDVLTSDQVFWYSSPDTLDGRDGNDSLTGSGGQDLLRGGAGKDRLFGMGEDDTLRGGEGNDDLDGGARNDLIDGGAGTDRAIFSGSDAATVDLSLTGAQDTGYGLDTLISIENVTSGSGNDRLTGNALANNLISGGGKDMLAGRGGNDVLTGGFGTDRIDGGGGNDRAVFSGAAAAKVNLSLTGAQDTGYGMDTLISIENVTSDSGNDRLTGNALANSLISGGGKDKLSGGGGNDILLGGSGNDVLIGGGGNDRIDGGTGTDRAVFFGTIAVKVDLTKTGTQGTGYGKDKLISIENVTSDSGNDILTGNALANSLISGGGKDKLSGGGGNDRLVGGSGNDLLNGGGGNDRLVGGAGRDSLKGGNGNDNLTGGGGGDIFVFTKSSGKDTIIDFGGNDSIRIESGANKVGDLKFTDTTAGLLIEFGTTDIFLKGLDRADISSSDFDFV